jgi:hypothetical protein
MNEDEAQALDLRAGEEGAHLEIGDHLAGRPDVSGD